MSSVRRSESAGNVRSGLRKDLLHALEEARCRLAIAIAAEARLTSWERRKNCLHTADRMRQLVDVLKNNEIDAGIPLDTWRSALVKLRQLPVKDGLQELYGCLNAVMASLEEERAGNP